LTPSCRRATTPVALSYGFGVDKTTGIGLDKGMSAAEIHNFLNTRPGVAAMRAVLAAEGVSLGQGIRLGTKPYLEGLLIDLMFERRG
jgi:hypothetical protein